MSLVIGIERQRSMSVAAAIGMTVHTVHSLLKQLDSIHSWSKTTRQEEPVSPL